MADDLLKDAQEAFEDYRDAWSANHADALDDLKFARLGDQWPDTIRNKRKEEGRPCLTINKLPAFIRQVVNDGRQNRPAITVAPADSAADPEVAEVFEGLIRNVEAQSDADVAYDTALESAVTVGFGYFRVNTDYCAEDGFEQDIRLKRVTNPFSVYPDPWSTAADSSDWTGCFVTDRMSKSRFEAKYAGAEAVDWDDYKTLGPDWFGEDGVTVAERWTRDEVKKRVVAVARPDRSELSILDADGLKQVLPLIETGALEIIGDRSVTAYRVRQTLMTGAEVLDQIDWPGRYIPIIPVWGEEVWVEGRRVFRSLIRDAKDPQRMFNFWRTASTELVALAPKAPFIGPKGAFKSDAGKWASANTDSHAFIEYDGQVAPQRQAFSGVPAGALQEALNASDDMKAIIGLYDASLGARSNETSGRAIMARQREGDVSTFHFIDNLSRAIRHGGRVLLDLIPHVYSTERMVRVLGVDGKPDVVKVNGPFQAPVLDDDGAPQRQTGPDGATLTDDAGQPLMQVVEKVYDLAAGKYDINVKVGPSYTSQREAAADQILQLAQAWPQIIPLVGDILAENLDWPGAEMIAKRLRAMLPPQISGGAQPGPNGAPAGPNGQPGAGAVPPEVMAQAQSLIQQLQDENQRLKMTAAAVQADRSAKNDANQIAAYRAETERMRAQHQIERPSRLPGASDFDPFG